MANAHPIRVGVVSGARRPYAELVQRWQEAEKLGFNTVWVTDHFITGNEPENDAEPLLEAWTVIAGLAMATERIRFGVMVTGNTYRNPALLAKQAVTVDHISHGRLELGFGAGWWVREHEAYGYPMPSNRELVDRFKEALEIIDGLQRNARFDYHGDYYWVTDAPFEPKPVQQPRIPMLVGAGGPRMLRLAARHADIWNTRGTVELAAERNQLLTDKCVEVGREPDEIRRSIWPFEHPWASVENVQQVIEAYSAVGYSDFVFGWPPDELHDNMVHFAKDVLPGLRG
ncbi:MAG: TIGR03560 family F420-dependent LLM class oxidoreductase [Vicinamibacterales bacterium]